jgi:hypothetical protein
MTDVGDREQVRDLAGELFGTPNVPRAYLRALRRCTSAANARIGFTDDSDSDVRCAYWLDGHSLGKLECAGVGDENATGIHGEIIQLDQVGICLRMALGDYDSFHRESEWGRVLTIGPVDDPFAVIDASPRPGSAARCEQLETFIDAVLAAVAGREYGGVDQ